MIASVVGLLALAALAHAIATVSRTKRRQLAVLRAIGFVRRDVAATLATSARRDRRHRTGLGIPLGLVAERLIWHALERQIGFESRAVAGFPVMLVIAVALVGAVGIGALLGWVAARRRPSGRVAGRVTRASFSARARTLR